MTEFERFMERHAGKTLILRPTGMFPHIKGNQVAVLGVSRDLRKTGGNPKTNETLVAVFSDEETVRDYSDKLRYCLDRDEVAA